MADAAIACDERPDSAPYSSVIIEHLTYDKSEDTEARGISKCARLLGGFNSPAWSVLRSNDRFRAAITKMIECAKAHPDEE